jgi:hypothetical protein
VLHLLKGQRPTGSGLDTDVLGYGKTIVSNKIYLPGKGLLPKSLILFVSVLQINFLSFETHFHPRIDHSRYATVVMY